MKQSTTRPMTRPWKHLGSRLRLAWRILADPSLAKQVETTMDFTIREKTDDPRHAAGALQLLALFQREGRLLDFLQEDIDAHQDAEIGAAVRVVHTGCRRALREHIEIEPVRNEPEGGGIRLEAGFNPQEISIGGNLAGPPPFSGRLLHSGWRATGVRLPEITPGHDPHILAPAEVEL